jgi:undecaprenyl-phosphate 4-deoxy-4-formamido-L-arabinose transferase|tara:strand:- start:67 stop:999 length:933 start_codon:yes stop_codon:yes gene_type:complete
MISIIIPVFNSENTIEILVNDIIKTLGENYKFEIILVNDCSKDKTEEKCKKLVEKYSNIFLFSLAKNVGEHNAVMAGLNKCLGDYAIIMDDDLQHSADSLLKLIKFGTQEKNSFDVVYTYYDKMEYNFFRNFGRKFNDLIANLLLDKPKSLYLSSFKLINRFLITEIIKYQSPFTYIDGIILGITNKIGRVKVEHSSRTHGKSGYTIKKLLQVWSSMLTGFSVVPLRMSLILGSLLSFLGFIFALLTFIERVIDNTVPSGYATIIIIVTIFSGAILIALGLIGEYVGRIFISLNKKPQFVIRDSWPNKKR